VDGVSARAKRRWLLRWWAVQAVALYLGVAMAPFLAGDSSYDFEDYGEVLTEGAYLLWMSGVAAFFATLQWVYLRPVRPPATSGKPVRLVWSMLIGALAVSAMILALLFTAGGVAQDVLRVAPNPLLADGVAGWLLLGLLVLNWGLATPLLLAFSDRSPTREDHLTRVATWLFAGTVIEVLAAIPLDVLARRHEDCWCARGTVWTITVGVTFGTILFGPVVFLVLLARRRRRWPGGRCTACGAEVGEDLRIARCPACGAGWAV
jgi:hypothetical protein